MISGMHANAGFIQDIQDSGQGGAELLGEANPLGFSPGKAPGGSVQLQVTHAQLLQDPEASTDLPEGTLGDDGLGGREIQARKPPVDVFESHVRNLVNGEAPQPYRARDQLEAASPAFGTRDAGTILKAQRIFPRLAVRGVVLRRQALRPLRGKVSPQPFAGGTGTCRVLGGKQAGGQIGKRLAARGASSRLTERHLLPVRSIHLDLLSAHLGR